MDLSVDIKPKALRETLCEAEAYFLAWMPDGVINHLENLQKLIAAVDQHRPLGPDGRHGDRHTETCGCEDK